MVYLKDPPLAGGTNQQELIRYIDAELEKIQLETQRYEAMVEALNIIGCSATWFWDDTGGLGEPPPGRMRGNVASVQNFTVMSINYLDAQGRDVRDLLKISSIEIGDLLGLVVQSGQAAGNYIIDQVTLFAVNHFTVFTSNYTGSPGNPQVDDIVELRWEFNLFGPQSTP